MASSLDLTAVLRGYVEKMLTEVQGMKVLLMDKDTTNIVSTVYTQSEVLKHEVFLVESLIKEAGDQQFHLKAVCFLRPTRENVSHLRKELRNPRYGEYHIFFSHTIGDLALQELADSDTKELVAQVQEFYGDYEALEGHHFSVPVGKQNNHVLYQPFSWDFGKSTQLLDRLVEGLASLSMSMRKRPIIRYQGNSEICQRVADGLNHLMYTEERQLYDFGQRGGDTVLLLLDRRDDPVTPLLLQWTYQAMVHDLLGIQDNRVDLGAKGKKVHKDNAQLVLSATQDKFYEKHIYSNYGDLGMAVKAMVDEFQTDTKSSKNIQSIQEMMQFVESFPEFREKQGTVSKHVTLLGEISNIVDKRSLMGTSQTEQELACSNNSCTTASDEVMELLDNPNLSDDDRLRLVMLFALRFEKEGIRQLGALVTKLQEYGIDKRRIGLVHGLLRYCGADKRKADLFGNRNLYARATTLARGLKGVDNVYTQHSPILNSTLEAAAKGRLSLQEYPPAGESASQAAQQKAPREVIAFILGGTTYEEARFVAQMNAATRKGEPTYGGVRFLLGGTSVVNSSAFMADLQALLEAERR
mmetsp:Transcript_4745/g.13162  ORF Transcript_4745/g.13162 Transcript_4745/m.13162 type:complete len:582 (-) Transcript_4745:177-1922(-)|eukprot:CAMPEP_0117658046 /NCGR_PEP_ID=MMETSP0804-20121206/5654_1 /TAXON_ID=1074897 /ORGANISM="Tetraselmis astigmatica, Strain CCMP880" /LENGTH=581 /DNA_ID=CAMNT_0005464539 /DNA_START=140 /DNA_END=1885 /DNA_ORIENTATION=-